MFLHDSQVPRGWFRNRFVEARWEKSSLEAQIASLDIVDDGSSLSEVEWSARYALEATRMQLHPQMHLELDA